MWRGRMKRAQKQKGVKLKLKQKLKVFLPSKVQRAVPRAARSRSGLDARALWETTTCLTTRFCSSITSLEENHSLKCLFFFFFGAKQRKIIKQFPGGLEWTSLQKVSLNLGFQAPRQGASTAFVTRPEYIRATSAEEDFQMQMWPIITTVTHKINLF